jgi:hypothetical protein
MQSARAQVRIRLFASSLSGDFGASVSLCCVMNTEAWKENDLFNDADSSSGCAVSNGGMITE